MDIGYQVYGRAPALESFWNEELNLGRLPATFDAIAAAEARFGVHLPNWLQQLYARYDGGAVQMAHIESLDAPRDWRKAEEAIPRARLLGAADLFSLAEVRLREEYHDDAYAGLATGGDHRLVVIAADDWSPGRALCLDYSGINDAEIVDEPIIVLVDAGEKRRLREFKSLSDWLDALIHIQYWMPALQSPYDDYYVVRWEPEAPSLDTFWSGPGFWEGAGNPATEQDIVEAEARLGVVLPSLMKALYRQQNGGYTDFEWVPLRPCPSEKYIDWCSMVIDKTLSSLKYVITLAEFASAFEDGDSLKDAAQLHARIDLMIVIANHNVDWLLCLDYRAGGPKSEPEVVYLDSWEALRPDYRARSFNAFFSRLRKGEMKSANCPV